MSEQRKPIILIGTPYYEQFSHQYVLSAFTSINELFPKYHLALSTAESSQIHINRNIIWKSAYDHKVDYLLYIDTDMMWRPDHITRLIESGKDIIGGLCTTRKKPPEFKYCVYENDGNGRCHPVSEVPNFPFKCWAIGTGFLLITQKVIKKMWDDRWKEGYPFDLMPHGLAYGKANIESMYLGEDISFCRRVHRQEIDIWCDPSVLPGHVGELVFGKDEPVLQEVTSQTS